MIEQGTAEWFNARLGKVTASRVADLVARTKAGWGASRANYMAQLIAERLTGVPQESYTSQAMQWGTDHEPDARIAYEFYRDATVELAGFMPHPSIADAGASPDGFVDADGLCEIKCPQTATHLETLLGDGVPGKYAIQMQWQMACTGRAWCDFVSYDPRLPEEMRLFVVRVPREPIHIASLEKDVREFLAELDAKVSALRARYCLAEAA